MEESKIPVIPRCCKILCPFCNAAWTAEMEAQLEYANEGCDTCGSGSSAGVAIKIYCSNCKRLICKKEGVVAE